jgi:phage/plasmid primase-like uncharacterized protein
MSINNFNVIADFKDFAIDAGIELPSDLIADGQLHRFKINGEKSGKLSGAYVLHLDDKPAGYVQDFRTDTKLTWSYNDPDYTPAQLTPKQREQQAKSIRQNKELTAQAEAEKHAAAAKKAAYIWEKSKPLADNQSHAYLDNKGIKGAYSIRVNDYKGNTSLVIPVGSGGAFSTLQFINADGSKRFLPDGKKKGCYSILNKMEHPRYVAIGEGFATIASVIEDKSIEYRTGFMGVMALDAGNLEAVAVAMREKYPNADIFIFGDIGDIDNKGEKLARAAAKLVNGYCVLPPMAKGDFNDYLTSGEMIATLEDLIIAATNDAPEDKPTETRTNATNPVSPTNTTPDNNTHNDILDNDHHHCTVDFLQFVDDRHTLKKLSLSIAKATHLPVHTVFLMGLGVFASVACRRWCVEYKHGGSLPIGLYVVAEQPSGAAKSRCLTIFQKPFYTAEKETKKTVKARLNELQKTDKAELTNEEMIEIDRLQSVIKSVLFTTNSTPEALEQSLTHSAGYFSAVSSEQGLFNTMLGGCYSDGKSSNNDLLLNGFDGGYMSSKRVGRESYAGAIVGGAVMFAQIGGIETLLNASNGTGLAERFLLIAEKHNLGNRDHTQTAIINHDLVEQYNAIGDSFARSILEDPAELDNLSMLDICPDGWQLIAKYRNAIEPHLADGGRYSHIALRGTAAKIDMQIMKLAANLHLLDNYQGETSTIALRHVKSAIDIANAMIEANLKLCRDKGIVGVKAEYMAILSLFESNQQPRTERNIIKIKVRTSPFKDFTGNKSRLIKETLSNMVNENILKESFTVDMIKMYSLAQ